MTFKKNKEPRTEWKKNFVKIDNECNLWDTGRFLRYSCITQDKGSVSGGPQALRRLRKSLGVVVVHFLLSNGKARMAAAEDNGKEIQRTFCIISWMNREADMHLWSSFSASTYSSSSYFSFACGMIFYNPRHPEISVYVLIIYARASASMALRYRYTPARLSCICSSSRTAALLDFVRFVVL